MHVPDKSTIAHARRLNTMLEATYDAEAFEGLPRLGLLNLEMWLCSALSIPSTARA